MLDGLTGLHNAEVITKAHMEETRRHFQQIHAAKAVQENAQQGNGLMKQVQALINFAKQARPHLPERQPIAAYETQTMPGV